MVTPALPSMENELLTFNTPLPVTTIAQFVPPRLLMLLMFAVEQIFRVPPPFQNSKFTVPVKGEVIQYVFPFLTVTEFPVTVKSHPVLQSGSFTAVLSFTGLCPEKV